MIVGTGRRGRRRKQVPNDFKEKGTYWNLIVLCGELALEDTTDVL